MAVADRCPTMPVLTNPTPICRTLSTVAGQTRWAMVLRSSLLDGSRATDSSYEAAGFDMDISPFTIHRFYINYPRETIWACTEIE